MSVGKGDKPRPTDLAKFRENYDNIFRKGKPILIDVYHPDIVKLRDHSKHSKKKKQ